MFLHAPEAMVVGVVEVIDDAVVIIVRIVAVEIMPGTDYHNQDSAPERKKQNAFFPAPVRGKKTPVRKNSFRTNTVIAEKFFTRNHFILCFTYKLE